jgi:hypothetical protein
MQVALAAVHHDPDGRLYAQTERVLPQLLAVFPRVSVRVTHTTQPRTVELLAAAGALVRREPPGPPGGYTLLGQARRAGVALGLELETPHLLFCDFDRALHWAERHPGELAQTAAQIGAYDFCVLGRTARAFASHARAQHTTEAAVNSAFAVVSGRAWDVAAAARGLSRRAAEALLADCREETIGTDTAWPLFLLRAGGFRVGYLATEGLEFETPDRYPDEVAAAGGLQPWLDRWDASLDEWALRLEIARLEIEAMRPFQT